MTTKTAGQTIEITATRTIGSYAIATLSDGREIGTRNVGNRWSGSLTEVSFVDTKRATWGEMITMRRGTSQRLALAEAITKLNTA